MRLDPSLGPWRRVPQAWTASPRRRRLAFVILLAPGGVMAVAGAQIFVSPPLMLVGLVWLAAAATARAASEPRFTAWENKGRPHEPEEELVS